MLLLSSCWLLSPKYAKGATVVSSTTFEQYTRLHKPICRPLLGRYTTCMGVTIEPYYDGRTLPTLYGNISGGQRSHTWNEYGLLPKPSPTSYKAQFWEAGRRTPIYNTTPVRYVWKATGHLTGTGTAQTFTPGIQGRYSTGYSTAVEVQMIYSASAGYGGKRIVVASINPASNRIGGIGPQGIPGTDATVTEPAVISAFAGAQTSSSLELIAINDTDQKLKVYNAANSNTMYVDGAGNQYWKTTSGDVAVKVLASGGFFIFKNNIKRFEIEDDGGFKQWLPNGTVGFRCYSSGICYGVEGLPSSNGLCITRNMTTGLESYITCGSDGGGSPAGLEGQTQIKRGSGFGAIPFAKFSSLNATEGILKIPAGYRSLKIVNSVNAVIMSLYSSKRVVIGGS